jgi:hypothetical protein
LQNDQNPLITLFEQDIKSTIFMGTIFGHGRSFQKNYHRVENLHTFLGCGLCFWKANR